MEFLKQLLGITSDPYESSQWKVFFLERDCLVTTRFGYQVPFHLAVTFEKIDHESFKRAQMLREESRWYLFDKVVSSIVLPRMTRNGRFVRLFSDRPTRPALCKLITEADGEYIALDVACSDLNAELSKVHFEKSGCKVTRLYVHMGTKYPPSDEIALDNYTHMKTVFKENSPENSAEYGAAEEALIIALAQSEVAMRRKLTICQAEGAHRGSVLHITTKMAGSSLQIRWLLNDSLARGEKVLGYRKEGGFSADSLPYVKNGECIADSTTHGETTYNLRAGIEYYFTFFVSDSTQADYRDMVRFSVRMPTEAELTRFDALLSRLLEGQSQQDKKINPKTKAALEAVQSFVEFDESVSQMEKEMIARIEKGPYTDEEKEEKIERLKAVVDSLRAENS